MNDPPHPALPTAVRAGPAPPVSQPSATDASLSPGTSPGAPLAPLAPDSLSPREQSILRARAALTAEAASSNGALWLLISLVLFIVVGSDNKLFDLVVLCAVILIHELGHAAAMKVFGYRDLKIFFIPFFGGAASGKKTGAPVWQQSIVLLAGPLPGLGIGLALAIVAAVTEDERFASAALQFVFINGFNLLPFAPLDGGRLIELALLGRHRWFATGFTVVSGGTLAVLAFALQSIALGFLAFLALITISYRAKLRAAVDVLRARLGTLPSDPTHVSDDVLVTLDETATGMHPEQAQLNARVATTRNLWEALAIKPPTGFGSFAILATWFVSLVGMFIVVVMTSIATSKPEQEPAPDAVPDAAPDAQRTTTPPAVDSPL